jgi:RimJ/RimL family protein N-acetyltransferase
VTELPVGEPADPTPAARPVQRSLQGRYVGLVPVDPDAHTPPLYRGSHGDDDSAALWTYMAYGPFPDPAAMREWLAELATSTDPLFLTAIDHSTASPVGVVSFMNIDPPMRRLELGNIWYVPAAQRTRANTEAAFLMLREAFDALGYRRVEWKCDALNRRSREAALRLGFAFEGVFHQHMIVKGRNRDTAWYAMLDRDWPRVRANMHRWLAEDPPPSLRELNRPG